ncbi:hypothetical protein LTR48_007342 [Friedmanniomyces endolithicus]|uniref:HNH endonuclease n=1 Tax=Rachicladosporium monterosium TaxID=1507873 RepID=A0ABR0KWD1_9PEZI|nr:hypothetical protein LTR48_007342 [Friedmanniomyces endolithicus]KAK5139598.1 hypothetical protein LTR32_007338 [Rachicladosporium monterosium]
MADEQSSQRSQGPASVPPPGSIVPVPRVRHLVTADGARIPYTRAEPGRLFNAGPIQQSIFGILETRDAVSLRHAVHARDQNGDLLRIPNTTCEDSNLGFPAGGRDDFNRVPNTRWTDGINGNQAHAAHMCLPHDWEDWWFHTTPRAQIEMDARYRLRLRKKPTRIGYKKSKKATPRDQMTPFQRRHCMKVVRRGRPDAVPRCFCGNIMSHAEHYRPNGRKVTTAAGLRMPIYQWRNCTGCNAFVNTDV